MPSIPAPIRGVASTTVISNPHGENATPPPEETQSPQEGSVLENVFADSFDSQEPPSEFEDPDDNIVIHNEASFQQQPTDSVLLAEQIIQFGDPRVEAEPEIDVEREGVAHHVIQASAGVEEESEVSGELEKSGESAVKPAEPTAVDPGKESDYLELVAEIVIEEGRAVHGSANLEEEREGSDESNASAGAVNVEPKHVNSERFV